MAAVKEEKLSLYLIDRKKLSPTGIQSLPGPIMEPFLLRAPPRRIEPVTCEQIVFLLIFLAKNVGPNFSPCNSFASK